MANTFYSEPELAALAKKFRMKSGKTKAALARELKVTRASMQDAEEHPGRNMTRLRIAIIEACSPHRIEGPLFALKRR
jgi:DNA-binding XRE family transcriptional regulator